MKWDVLSRGPLWGCVPPTGQEARAPWAPSKESLWNTLGGDGFPTPVTPRSASGWVLWSCGAVPQGPRCSSVLGVDAVASCCWQLVG